MAQTTRSLILKAVKDRIKEKQGGLFRHVARGPWNPMNAIFPAAFVTSTGQKRSDRINSDAIKGRILSFRIWLDLSANWDREQDVEDWEDHVQTLIDNLQNYKAAGGVKRLDYMADEQLEVLLKSGETRQLWSIDFDVEYWEEYAEFGA
jgi:hypothetical protein